MIQVHKKCLQAACSSLELSFIRKMKKIKWIIVIVCFPTICFGQIRKSFDHLMTKQVRYHEKATFTLDSLNSLIYNEKYVNIKKKPSGFSIEDFECEFGSIIIADVLIDKTRQRRAILTLGVCPDYEFNLYDIQTKELIKSFHALNITISGNGSIYTSGHLNEFNLRQKFTFDGKTFIEEKQPFYYIGIKSKTLREIKIYSDKELKKVLAILPSEHEIEVMLAEQPYGNNFYLVRTSFGLIGWAILKSGQYKSIDVEGLFYNND